MNTTSVIITGILKCHVRVIIITVLLNLVFSYAGKGQASVSGFQFKQYDRHNVNGVVQFVNSSLGSVSFLPGTSPSAHYYLNVFAKTVSGGNAWIVRNFPLPAGEQMVRQQVEIDFKFLGYKPGVRVGQLQYNYSLSQQILKPAADVDGGRDAVSVEGATSDDVIPEPVFILANVDKDIYSNEESVRYQEFVHYAIFKNQDPVKQKPVSHDVPDVEEDRDKCTEGAFARSIAWLDEKYQLGMKMSAKEIYDSLKKRLSGCVGKPDESGCKVKAKADFFKEKTGGRGSTTITVPLPGGPFWGIPPDGVPKDPPPAKPGDWIKGRLDTCDVEMAYYNPAPPPHTDPDGAAHIVTVTRIECDDKGCCTIWFKDDEKQGLNGGTGEKSVKMCGSSFERFGGKRELWFMVAECVSPAPSRLYIPNFNEALAGNDANAPITLLQNTPNPFGGSTTIGIRVKKDTKVGTAQLIIRNSYGNEVQRIRLNLQPGLNNIPYTPGRDAKGLLYYTLQVDGQTIATRQMMTELQEPQPKPRP